MGCKYIHHLALLVMCCTVDYSLHIVFSINCLFQIVFQPLSMKKTIVVFLVIQQRFEVILLCRYDFCNTESDLVLKIANRCTLHHYAAVPLGDRLMHCTPSARPSA